MRVKDVMSDGVMSIASDATVYEAIELLVNTRVSALPVVDDAGIMIGIVSEADLIKYAEFADGGAAAFDHLRSHPVTAVMSTEVVSVDEDASLGEVATLMRKHGAKRLPVLRDRSVVGIVSRINLLQALVSHAAPGDVPKHPGAAPRPQDEELRRAVLAAVDGKNWSLAQGTDVVVSGGIAHLWGMAPSESVCEAYRAAAIAVPGIVGVETHMHIARPG
jgi:CBS domain-containing protein